MEAALQHGRQALVGQARQGHRGGRRLSLPALNACLNATAGALLISGYLAIRARKLALHQWLMGAAVACSAAFLVNYLYYHAQVGSVRYRGDYRSIYFPLLISHTILATVIVPMILRGLYLAWTNRLAQHARLSRWTFPLWLYVSVTGVAVYWMLYRMPQAPAAEEPVAEKPAAVSVQPPDADETLWKIRGAELEKLAAAPGQPYWAGYYVGPPQLVMAREGFYFSSGADGDFYEAVGPVKEQDGEVLLSVERDRIVENGLRDLPQRWIPVHWGSAVYLIIPRGTAINWENFVHHVNANLRPEGRRCPHMWFMQKEAGDCDVSVLPVVPEPWRSRLLTKPIEARVVAVERAGPEFHVRLDSDAPKGARLYRAEGPAIMIDESRGGYSREAPAVGERVMSYSDKY